MKKTKFIFAMMLAWGNQPNSSQEVSSSEDSTTETPNSSSDTQVITEVSEEEWQESLTNFAEERNFSLTQSVDGEAIGAMKLEGTTYYEIYGENNINEYYYIKEVIITLFMKKIAQIMDYGARNRHV